MTPFSAKRPLGHQPPCAMPTASAASSAPRSAPVCPPETIFRTRCFTDRGAMKIENPAQERCAAALIVALLLWTSSVRAEDKPSVPDFPRTAPLEPAEALKSFKVLHGFSMQLVASEPLIADPVDVAYDEDGRAYVV